MALATMRSKRLRHSPKLRITNSAAEAGEMSVKASISKAWDESRTVIGRDGKVLVAIALALLVLPGLIADLFMPDVAPGELPPMGLWMIAVLIAFLIALVGQLAIIRIASGGGVTAGQAISHAAGRAPVYIAATILWTLPFVLLVFAVTRSINPEAAPTPGVALMVLIAAFVLFFGGLFVFIRLLMCGPVASNETAGPVAILRRSWQLTKGNWWRLFGFFLLFMIAAVVIMMFAGIVGGIIGALISGDPQPMTVGALLVSLVTQVAGAAVSVVFSVMLARIYVQLAGSGQAQVSVPSTGD